MPSAKRYRLHPEAWAELEIADDWYFAHSVDASIEFLSSLDEALDKISNAPLRWPSYLHGTRRYVLPRFPFSIVYLDENNLLTVIAIAHSKRKPGYWKDRL
jgi:toxin ParE1/3/4